MITSSRPTASFENQPRARIPAHDHSHRHLSAAASTAGSLTVLIDSLERIVRDSEDDFLELGANLQKVRLQSLAQRQAIAATIELFRTDGNSGILQQISTYVEESQRHTRDGQQTAASLCADLATMIKLMDSIARKTLTLGRTGLFLQVIGINTGIECARHGRMEAMFKVVSQETILLSEQIRQTTESLLEQTAKARAEGENTLSGAQRNIESLQRLVQTSNTTTETALARVTELVDFSISLAGEVERMAAGIGAQISRVVIGVQFHDNLRQRIEHIGTALREVDRLPDAATEEELCDAYLSVVFQKAQLDNLITELEQLHGSQSQALTTIIEAVSQLEQRLTGITGEAADASARDNPVAILLGGINTLEQLNSESQTVGRDILGSSERAERIAEEMRGSIQNTFTITNNVKINALNAIIKAAKFGRIGESLQVLAQGMVSVSNDTRALVNHFNELLEQLGDLVKNEKTTAAQQTALSVATGFDCRQVEQVFHLFRDKLQTSKSDCHGLTENLAREQGHLVFIVNLRQTLQQHALRLGDYAESIRPQNTEMLERRRADFGRKLEERYTMNEERKVHDQLHRAQAIPAAAQVAVAADGDDGFFFTGASEFPKRPETVGQPAAIDLWDEPAAAMPTPPESPEAEEKAENFGDNIELF